SVETVIQVLLPSVSDGVFLELRADALVDLEKLGPGHEVFGEDDEEGPGEVLASFAFDVADVDFFGFGRVELVDDLNEPGFALAELEEHVTVVFQPLAGFGLLFAGHNLVASFVDPLFRRRLASCAASGRSTGRLIFTSQAE